MEPEGAEHRGEHYDGDRRNETKLLGHKHIETTLLYSRVYDSTIAAGYYQAMRQIEGTPEQPLNCGDLLALIDMLQSGTLDDAQQEAVQMLRNAIVDLGMNKMFDDNKNDGFVSKSD